MNKHPQNPEAPEKDPGMELDLLAFPFRLFTRTCFLVSSDQEWEANVRQLVRNAERVFLDRSVKTPSVLTEVSICSEERHRRKCLSAVWRESGDKPRQGERLGDSVLEYKSVITPTGWFRLLVQYGALLLAVALLSGLYLPFHDWGRYPDGLKLWYGDARTTRPYRSERPILALVTAMTREVAPSLISSSIQRTIAFQAIFGGMCRLGCPTYRL